ncbi:transglycosylase SLT domain-containing protein [candidate division KSB1 bacterium]|nr:transglycosylase SLT domain-containing protein [candidate division KSB1 bacterium]
MIFRGLIILMLLLGMCYANVQPDTTHFDIDPVLFPVPENLVPNVKFWIDVFSKYTSQQVILHDNTNLNIVYDVIDFREHYGNSVVITRKHWKKVDQSRDKIKKTLLKLADMRTEQLEELSEDELKIYEAFPPPRNRSAFRRAAYRIRGQMGLRDKFEAGLIQSGQYIEEMTRIFEQHAIPQDLMYLPHVESSFNIKSYSRVGAAGMWQFTRRTGRRFMKINYAIDERCDPFYSTEAAAKLLKHNYGELRSWPIAITAYNHGLNGMRRAKKICGTSDLGVIVKKYKSRSFGFASRNFYAEFVAAVHVRKNYQEYFQQITFDVPWKFSYLIIPRHTDIRKLANDLDLNIQIIKEMNPAFRKPVLRAEKHIPRGFQLRIPWRPGEEIDALYASISGKQMHRKSTDPDLHLVEAGESLESIAREENVHIDSLLAFNNIQNRHRIYAGDMLKLSSSNAIIEDRQAEVNKPELAQSSPTDAITVPRQSEEQEKLAAASSVKIPQPAAIESSEINLVKIDTAEIASQPISISTHDAMEGEQNDVQVVWNEVPIEPVNIERPSYIGDRFDRFQHLNIVPPAPPQNKVRVRPNETLGHFADWLEIPTQNLRKINGLKYGQDIQINDQIRLIFANVAWEDFHRRREEYHKSIEEDFFEHFKIENVLIHSMKEGENVWYLCKQVYEIPYWLLLKYNAHIDLKRLKVGDEIIIPVLSAITSMKPGGKPEIKGQV